MAEWIGLVALALAVGGGLYMAFRYGRAAEREDAVAKELNAAMEARDVAERIERGPVGSAADQLRRLYQRQPVLGEDSLAGEQGDRRADGSDGAGRAL